MRIICDAPGQTCNRLWSYIGPLSECIAKNKRMAILFFDYTIVDFPHLRDSKYVWFPFFLPKWLNNGNHWNLFKGITWKMTHYEPWQTIFRALHFTKGWNLRNETRFIAQAKAELIRIFQPSDEILAECRANVSACRGDIVVGVHIRRGDYKTWNEGKFYYGNAIYRNLMNQIVQQMEYKRVSFIICSNENVDIADFEGLDCRTTNVTNALVDIYTLSMCDYIMGPPSTFSRWASFIGEKPLYFILDPKQPIAVKDFSEITDYFHFADGREIYDW